MNEPPNGRTAAPAGAVGAIARDLGGAAFDGEAAVEAPARGMRLAEKGAHGEVAGPTWAPFDLAKRLEDLDALAVTPLFASVPPQELAIVSALLELGSVPPRSAIARRGQPMAGATIVLAGRASTGEGGEPMGPGRHWGEAALEVELPEPRDVTAIDDVRIARLPRRAFQRLRRSHPAIALELLRRAFVLLALAPAIEVNDAPRRALTASARVPARIGDTLVVAARSEGRTIGLSEAVAPDVSLEPVTIADWEGREVYRRTAGLVFLEACERLGRRDLALGPSWTSGRRVVGDVRLERQVELARALTAEMVAIAHEARPVREEVWSVEAAAAYFERRGWADARALLETRTGSRIVLVSCGEVRVPRPGAMLPSTGWVADARVEPHPDGLYLDFGDRVRRELAPRPLLTRALEIEAPRYGSAMTAEERSWLDRLGIRSVGAFNRACVTGEVRDLIDVAEGFHEKRLASLADRIAESTATRVVAVAGPSSSGKTTFLKRLVVQLRVAGIVPIGLSLDDYYVDRSRTVRDAKGDYDYEALEAIDGDLLRGHLGELLLGNAVRTARYDFVTGLSDPRGGPELRLADRGILLVEGIHALNPALYSPELEPSMFRVFIHPATALAFDPLSSMEPADVRLLRRVVRDRHARGSSAESNLARWPSVRRGERLHIDPFRPRADCIFDTSLVYEPSVLKVFAERYLLEVPRSSAQFAAATRLRELLEPFVPIYADRVPPTSILREFIGASGFTY